MRLARSFYVGLAVLFSACNSPSEPEVRRVIGDIDDSWLEVIRAPAAVSRGQLFDVTVSTIGNSCVSAAGADVDIDGMIATITPYDFVTGGVCLDYARAYPRTVKLSFGSAGTATIRVRGRSYFSEFVTVAHTLVVNQ